MEDDPSTSTYTLVTTLNDDIEEDSGSLPEDSKSDIMPIMAEVSSSNDEERISVFKTEHPSCSEICSMEMEQFAEVEEVEMDSMMKTEVIGLENTDDRDTEPIHHLAPQQFIILTRTTDGSGESAPAKYIRFDGADGQTYVLAVSDNVLTTDPTKVMQTQHPTKNVKSGRNRQAGPSNIVASPSTNCRVKSSHNANADGINQAWFTTRDDKNALHSEGHKWKQGQWTKEEIEILESNINSYCKEHSIKDPAEVIFEMSKDERKDFYRTIALGIQRPLFSVYRRVTRMYDQKNHRGKYTPNEMKALRVLRAKHGNDWAAIGGALGRSASSVKDKCRLMKDNCNSGKWYPEEEERLAAAVYKLTGLKPSESITSGLSWASVSEHVGTRSEKQCRTKWLNYLNWKQQGGADWTRDDDTMLIEKVSKMDVTNDTEIDWVALSQDWASVRSPQWLRGKWWALKRHIADYNKLSYSALLEQMNQVIHWSQKPKLGTRQLKSDGAGTSDIFKECIPVSLTAGVDGSGSLSLSYCPSDEEGFQAFEVLQQWTPQIITQAATSSDGDQGILSGGTSHIIVANLGSAISDSIQLNGQQQVIINTTAVSADDDAGEGITIQEDGLVQNDQDLSNDNLHDGDINSFTTSGEEITVSEYHSQPETGDMMSHDVFETVTAESSSDLVMGVTSPHHASSLMTSLKDPILMSSSDVECEKSQNADESAELTD